MLKKLDKIRKSDNKIDVKNQIIYTSIIFCVGIILGIFSKWLDNLSIDDSIWWMSIIGKLNLRNFFSNISIWLLIALIISIYSKSSLKASLNTFVFFVGVTVSYHLYTVLFSGFNPKNYMMIWYGLTIVSPLLAFICFYSKSDNKISIIISSLILYVMFSMCFNIGMWYFDIKTILDLIVFLISCYVLYVKPKNIVISLFIGLVLSFLIRIPYYI